MYNTPFNYNVLINPYIKNHFRYINIVCRLISVKMYQLMLLVDQNFTVLLNPIAYDSINVIVIYLHE